MTKINWHVDVGVAGGKIGESAEALQKKGRISMKFIDLEKCLKH